MAINGDTDNKNYTLGRGEVYIELYPANATINEYTKGLGERYIGNTPEFSTSQSSETLDHYDSDKGVKEKDASVQLSQDRTGSFTTDNINSDNTALQFLGTKATLTQVSATGVTETLTAFKSRYLQLGKSVSNPTGVRKTTVTGVTLAVGGTTVQQAGNYEVDDELGRVYIPKGSTIGDNIDIVVTYNVAASTRTQVVSSSNAIYGALHFIGRNPVGPNKDYYFPYVKIAPDGDYALKGDDWQTIGFTFDILKKGTMEAVYIDGRAGVV